MGDKKDEILDEAIALLQLGDIKNFCQRIVELFHFHMTCDCFLNQKRNTLLAVFNKECIDKLKMTMAFDADFALGFIFWLDDNKRLAYKYLSSAIELNPNLDVLYSIRSTIDNSRSDIDKQRDAHLAVNLYPSARNYFVLANRLANSKFDTVESLKYYEQAIKLNANFPCAYYQMGKVFETRGSLFGEASELYKKCLELNPVHKCYYDLWKCLLKVGQYEEALSLLLLRDRNDDNYFFLLSHTYSRLLLEDEAKKYLAEYERKELGTREWIRNISSLNSDISRIAKKKALAEFKLGNYKTSAELFSLFIARNGVLYDTEIDTFTLAKIKIKDPLFSAEPDNPIYAKFNSIIRESIRNVKKDSASDLVSKEIKKIVLYHSNSRVHFGKYKGETVGALLEIDSHYILWCIINLFHFCVSKELLINLNHNNEPEYLAALKMNLLKSQIISFYWPEPDANFDYEDDYDRNQSRRDTFDALTDGQLGSFDDFQGDIDDIFPWAGL